MKLFFWIFLLFFFPGIASAQQIFQHTTSEKNISANSTYLSAEGLNNNPNAVIIVEYDAVTAKANPHAVGVWYTGSQWAIFNQDMAAMPAGISFSISWKNPDGSAFSVKSSNGVMILDHPSLNNNPSASFYASQVWNPGGTGGVYNNAAITVSYDSPSGKWYVKNLNGYPLPEGAAFNISIVGGSKNTIANNPALINADPGVIKNAMLKNNSDPKQEISNKIDPNAIKNAPVINQQQNPANTIAVDPGILINILNDANLGFENRLIKWTASGTAFANQPVEGNTVMSERVLGRMSYNQGGIGGDYWKGLPYNIGIKDNYWIGTYENGNGDAPTGAITSSPFRAEKRYLTFLLGGGKDINKLYVELQVKKSDYEAAWGAGRRGLYGDTEDGFTRVNRITSLLHSEELFRYYFDLNAELNNQFAGKTVRVRIVDEKTSSWGHINADDFVFKDNLNDFISLFRDGFSLYADNDKPVWGFGDTHAHWVNHVGLNGLMHGRPGGNWQTSDVRRDIPPCDGFNHGLPTLTPGMLIAQTEKAAWNRIPERLADPGNALCMTGVVATGIVFWPSGVATAAGAGIGALFGSIGQAASGAHAATGALDGTITGTVWGLMTNPAFQACGYLFTKDVLARHYGNYTPADRPEISNYVDFPRWNSFFHQMMHITWVRRSYDGGQRLMVVPVGVAKSWEFNATSDGIMGNPKQHIENAIAELRRIVNLNSDWMAIAETPKRAREIILSNKMAVVIALEHAEVGNYFQSVQEEVDWLHRLGVRHIFPIHNINNKLGGAAVFNSALNSYNDLVNRLHPEDEIRAFRVRDGNSADDTRTTVKLERNFMRQNLRTFPVAGFGTIPFFYSNDVPADYHYDDHISHKNAAGLSDKGRQYLSALMRKGMVIDVDHMSDLSQNEVMQTMRTAAYPMISGHTNFRELRRENNETAGGDKEARLKTENTIFGSRVNEINDAGGMFGLMTQQNNVRNADGCPVPNNSPGGSGSFAQAYWYTLQKTGGEKGIAFGSDFNGFAPQVAPRFGVEAAFMLEGDGLLNQNTGPRGEDKLRRAFAFQQTNGVRYDVPVKTHHYHRFLKPPFLTSEEREIWEAIAIAKSVSFPPNAWQPGGGLSVERTGLQQDKVKNMAEGFRHGFARAPEGDYGTFLECPEYISRIESLNNCMPERKAAYMCVRGFNSLPEHMRTQRTLELFAVMNPIYQLWMQFENGPNEPLRRSFAYPGGRDFDFNLDGLAHYGMFPDLIQDMKNQGLNPQQLKPIFLAAEQYIQMWEKAEVAKANFR